MKLKSVSLGLVFVTSTSFAQLKIYQPPNTCESADAIRAACAESVAVREFGTSLDYCIQSSNAYCASITKTVPSFDQFQEKITSLTSELNANQLATAKLRSDVEVQVIKSLDMMSDKVLSSVALKDLQEKTRKQVQCEMGNLRRMIRAELDAKGGRPAISQTETCTYL